MPEIGQKIGTARLVDEAVTSAKIADGTIVNADIATLAAIAYTKLATSPRIARIKTGTYTGDGSTGQAITGVGFAPKLVIVAITDTGDSTANDIVCFRFDTLGTGMSVSNYLRSIYDHRIKSLDADGFTVDDDGADYHPNKANQGYGYIALG